MKFTFKQILAFNEAANGLITRMGEYDRRRLLYAVVKNQKKVKPIIDKFQKKSTEEFNELLADLNIEYASVDKDKNVIKDEKGRYSYTQENHKKLYREVAILTKKMDEKLEEEKLVEYDIEPYHCTDIDVALTMTEEECFAGFVYPEELVGNFDFWQEKTNELLKNE